MAEEQKSGGVSDEDMEGQIGILLRSGTTLASVVIMAGGVLFLVRHGGQKTDFGVFHGEPKSLTTLKGVLSGALHGRALGILQLGIMLLVATPVARVVLCIYGFARERDRMYVLVSTTVLLVLLYSLIFK